jgi:hypothetical protein
MCLAARENVVASRTYVSMSVQADALDEARRALWSLVVGSPGPVEVYGSQAPDGATDLVVSLRDDVQQRVEEQLAETTALSFEVEVRGEGAYA